MDNEILGFLICKIKDNVVVEYVLEFSREFIGILEYNLFKLLFKNYKSSLFSIEEIEEKLKWYKNKEGVKKLEKLNGISMDLI